MWGTTNCFKKRSSSLQKSRMSGISYRIMASLSKPKPNAQPIFSSAPAAINKQDKHSRAEVYNMKIADKMFAIYQKGLKRWSSMTEKDPTSNCQMEKSKGCRTEVLRSKKTKHRLERYFLLKPVCWDWPINWANLPLEMESENNRMVRVGKDLWASPSPISLLKEVAQDQSVQVGLESLQRRQLHLWGVC